MSYIDLERNLHHSAIRKRRIRLKIRNEILRKLGGKCKSCGFSDPRALHIDHVYGGGSKERKELGEKAYRLILQKIENQSSDYQLLCANCNSIKRFENREDTHRKYDDFFLKSPAALQGCGTRAAYQRGCRCAPCVEANRSYCRQYHQNKR